MTKPGNILFIMCDQLRYDYLSCYGHKTLQTPNIDRLAERGVTFTNAYCQSPLCSPSRASFYSGRYMSSHGVMAIEDATRLDEKMIADYLRPRGYRTAVVGKTHSFKNQSEMASIGIDMNSDFARASQSGGFEPYELHEGDYPDPILPQDQGYTNYLRSLGYDATNPWDRCANSGIDGDGKLHSGWSLRSSIYPAAIREEHSETAFTTRRAMDFIDDTGSQPWCLHLSYIKPHWPVIAPAPYHEIFNADDLQPVVHSEQERENPHPVYEAFMQQEYSESYSREEVRKAVIPVYMGLIKQVDDHLGRLFEFMDARGLFENTLIVFTADHGDYLGDHWLGEKDLFHEASAKIPLILVDPSSAANTTRGTKRSEFVEAVDIVPSFIDFAGAKNCRERLEGKSLLPLLHSSRKPDSWRDITVSEIDYSDRGPRSILGLEPYQCRAIMVRDSRWKYIYHQEFVPQLFDLENDPNELDDLGRHPNFIKICAQMKERIFLWRNSLKRRTGLEYDYMTGQGPARDEELGFIIGRW
jgi:arylsulfatase A-like enzyme